VWQSSEHVADARQFITSFGAKSTPGDGFHESFKMNFVETSEGDILALLFLLDYEQTYQFMAIFNSQVEHQSCGW